jgi:hypothetical protein
LVTHCVRTSLLAFGTPLLLLLLGGIRFGHICNSSAAFVQFTPVLLAMPLLLLMIRPFTSLFTSSSSSSAASWC